MTKEKADQEAKPDLQSPAEEAVIDTVNAAHPAPPATINTGGTATTAPDEPEIWAQIIKGTGTDLSSADITAHYPVSGDTPELYLVPQKYKDRETEDEINTPGNTEIISFMAESLKVVESETPPAKINNEYVDIEVSILSTQITLNGTQYTLDDLKSNATELNACGGLIFAMGTHDFDATSNVGLGQTFLDEKEEMLKAKARIYNTSTYPDMVRRLRLGLVRDVSIEGAGKTYKKMCRKTDCWIKVFGLKIKRATFVWAGADERAKITKVLESLAGPDELNEYNKHNINKLNNTEKVNNLKKPQIEPVDTDTQDTTATAKTKEAEAVAAEVQETNTGTETEAKEAEVKNTQDIKAVFENIMTVCSEMKKVLSDMKDMIEVNKQEAEKQEAEKQEAEKQEAEKQEAKKQEAEKQEAAQAEKTEVEVQEEIKEQKLPKVKESLATPGSASSNFFEQVKDLVR